MIRKRETILAESLEYNIIGIHDLGVSLRDISKHIKDICDTDIRYTTLSAITTISTDFKMMGTIAAEIIKSQNRQDQEAPFYLTLRPSL